MREKNTEEINFKYCPTCKSELVFRSLDNQVVLGCARCSFIFWNNPRPVVSALIIIDGKVLMIKRKSKTYNNFWSLPGGIINFLEEPTDSLKREVFEECNLSVTTAALIDAYLIVYAPFGLNKKPSHTSIDIIYKCEIKETSIVNQKTRSKEVSEMSLFPKSDLPKKIAFKHRDIIYKFMK